MLLSIANIKHSFGQTESFYEKAIRSYEQKKYQEADYFFRKALREKKQQPVQLNYFYGATLLQLGKTELAEKFLIDFMENAEPEDTLFKKTKVMLVNLNPKNCQKCKGTFYVGKDTTCFSCEGKGKIETSCLYCKGSKRIPCVHCKGSGMQTQTDKFSKKSFHKCEPCSGSGFEPCNRCKLEVKNFKDCERCKGRGVVVEKQSCNHVF